MCGGGGGGRIYIFGHPHPLMHFNYQGSHPTWNLVIFFSRPGIYSKSGKTCNFNSKLYKKKKIKKNLEICKFYVSSFTFDFTAFAWKIHGILCHKRCGNPASVLIHFEIFFLTKTCMKVPGNGTKNLGKNWNLGPKTWNLGGGSGNPGFFSPQITYFKNHMHYPTSIF